MMTSALPAIVERRFAASIQVPARFFDAQADLIAQTCLAMARRFHRGGRLLVFGEGAEATDAQHVAVEFVHPVIVGKRALPAIALPNDYASLTGIARLTDHDSRGTFARALEVLGRPQDIALGISRRNGDGAVREALARAARIGMLTVGVAGTGDRNRAAGAPDFTFVVGSDDPLVVQETQETLYHVLWELVHVFFDHGLVSEEIDALH